MELFQTRRAVRRADCLLMNTRASFSWCAHSFAMSSQTGCNPSNEQPCKCSSPGDMQCRLACLTNACLSRVTSCSVSNEKVRSLISSRIALPSSSLRSDTLLLRRAGILRQGKQCLCRPFTLHNGLVRTGKPLALLGPRCLMSTSEESTLNTSQ